METVFWLATRCHITFIITLLPYEAYNRHQFLQELPLHGRRGRSGIFEQVLPGSRLGNLAKSCNLLLLRILMSRADVNTSQSA